MTQTNDCRYKSFGAQIKDINEAQGIVTIAISRFNVEDRAGDIVRKGAFKKTMREQIDHIKHQIDHSMSVSDMVGIPVKMWETEDYAMVDSALALNTTQGRNVFELYKLAQKKGRSLEHSYRYVVIGRNNNDEIAGEDISELALRYEYSTVVAGCNPDTPLLDIKSAEGAARAVKVIDEILKGANFTDDLCDELERYKQTIQRGHSDDEPTPSLVKEPLYNVQEVENIIKSILI